MPPPENESFKIVVPDDTSPQRLDRYLAGYPDLDLTRSHLQRLIAEGRVTVNGEPVAKSCEVKPGDRPSFSVGASHPATSDP